MTPEDGTARLERNPELLARLEAADPDTAVKVDLDAINSAVEAAKDAFHRIPNRKMKRDARRGLGQEKSNRSSRRRKRVYRKRWGGWGTPKIKKSE